MAKVNKKHLTTRRKLDIVIIIHNKTGVEFGDVPDESVHGPKVSYPEYILVKFYHFVPV